MLLLHLFVCFARFSFCPFSLPLGVGGWLRLVIVVLPGLSINLFVSEPSMILVEGSRAPEAQRVYRQLS